MAITTIKATGDDRFVLCFLSDSVRRDLEWRCFEGAIFWAAFE